jgi:protein tyrosine phosphatase
MMGGGRAGPSGGGGGEAAAPSAPRALERQQGELLARFNAAAAAVADRLAGNPGEVRALYARLPQGLSHRQQLRGGWISQAALRPELVRYSDCFPQDSHLAPMGPGAGFLNASLVELPGPGKFIAAAGPMAPEWHGPDTRPAFWSAAWVNSVPVIVALAVPQPGFQGCAEYAATATHGPLALERVAEEVVAGGAAVERKLRLTDGDGSSRELTQLEFSKWPNYGVPGAASSVAALAHRVLALQQEAEVAVAGGGQQRAGPMLVHCAGGVGRTGSFVTLLSVWQDRAAIVAASGPPAEAAAAEAAVIDAVCGRIALLREQRHPYSVESDAQLGLIFSALSEMARDG